MSRCTAEDLLQTFLVSISDLDQSKILQVASDSPSVNFLFLKKIWLSHERKKSCYLFLILADVDFMLSIIDLKQGRKKEVIANFKNC